MLTVVWCIFGAILNPTSFLPYAAASLVVLFFVITQVAAIRWLYRSVRGISDEAVQKKLRTRAARGRGLRARGGGGLTAAAEAKRNSVIDAVRKAAAAAGLDKDFDLEALLQVVGGDLSDVVVDAVADSVGAHTHVARALVAAIKDDGAALERAARTIAGVDGVAINAELAAKLVALARASGDAVRSRTPREGALRILCARKRGEARATRRRSPLSAAMAAACPRRGPPSCCNPRRSRASSPSPSRPISTSRPRVCVPTSPRSPRSPPRCSATTS